MSWDEYPEDGSDDPDTDEDEDDPKCPDCGCDLFTEFHSWDCEYAGDD